jgi:hypothetical protein
MWPGSRGPQGPAGSNGATGATGATGPVGLARAIAFVKAAASGDEIEQASGETVILTKAITPVADGSLLVRHCLFPSGAEASAIIRIRISGGAYTDEVLTGASIDAALGIPISFETLTNVEGGEEYTVEVTADVTGAGFFQMFVGSSLTLQETATAT